MSSVMDFIKSHENLLKDFEKVGLDEALKILKALYPNPLVDMIADKFVAEIEKNQGIQ